MTTKDSQIRTTERELERFLATYADAGIPEVVLVAVLRDYATTIETIGYVPRTWRRPGRSETRVHRHGER